MNILIILLIIFPTETVDIIVNNTPNAIFPTETVPQLSEMSAPTAYRALTSHLLLIRFDFVITTITIIIIIIITIMIIMITTIIMIIRITITPFTMNSIFTMK